MTIDEAIKKLERRYILHFDIPLAEQIKASLLGIEALKRIRHDREAMQVEHVLLLPGETEE